MTPRSGCVPVICLTGLLGACASGLELTLIEAADRPPAHVAVYFRVQDAGGEPVADLDSRDFRIYDDGELVSAGEGRLSFANPRVVARHHTLLLVDMSASVTSRDQVQQLVAAAEQFVARVEPSQKVAVYAFDGSRKLHPISPFTASERPASEAVTALAHFETSDPATNLHGAVIQALDIIDRARVRSRLPLNFGTLVVFTDGTDRAARVSLQAMLDRLDATDYAVFAIGVGDEIDDGTLSRVGRDGYIRVDDRVAAARAFEQLGARIVARTRQHYLLSYCSAARAGKHVVTIQARDEHRKGELRYAYDAAGFGPGCDAKHPPAFD